LIPLWVAFLAIGIGCYGLALLIRHWPHRDPPAVRVSPEVLDQMRSEIVFNAIKGTALYPNGSVPYGDTLEHPETAELRAKRFACAGKNHHPRHYDGSWCMGYGYVCSRCAMYADPVPRRQLQAMCDALNQISPEDQQIAAAQMAIPKGSRPGYQRSNFK
jgi:hypothetical protein